MTSLEKYLDEERDMGIRMGIDWIVLDLIRSEEFVAGISTGCSGWGFAITLNKYQERDVDGTQE